MANIEERTLTLVYGTTKNYFSGSGLYIDYQGWSQQPMAIWGTKNGTATMKDAGKAVLYPKAGIHPFKADLSMIGATSVDDAVMKIYFDDVLVFDDWWYNNSQEETKLVANITDSCILNSTINSSITVNLSASQTKLMGGFGMRNNSYFKLYFQQWDLVGYSTGDGVQAVMSPGRVYNGETVTFSTLLNDNSIFHGWYRDAAHTQLVSTDQTYITTASADLTLYAYATKKPDKYNNKLYFKGQSNNSKWKHPYSIYKKTINGWELQSNTNSIPEGYNYSNASIAHNFNNTTYRVTAKVRTEPYTIYFLNNNLSNRPLTSISNSTSFEFIPIEEGLALIYNGNYNSSTQTLTVQWYSIEDFLIRTMTIEATPQTYTQEIYFIDKDGNKFTETKISNEAYTVTTPSGYTNFIGWKEYRGNAPTGRILEVGQSYYDVGSNKQIYYEPVFSE